MPRGQQPKDAATRRRRNSVATAAELPADGARGVRAPSLTQDILGGRVDRRTRRWWEVIWKSPMAGRWLPSDVEGLYLVAILRNEFFLKPSAAMAAEIRQQEARFGLTPIDRRRLDWRIEGPRQAEASPAPTVPAAEPPAETDDPRRVLRVLA